MTEGIPKVCCIDRDGTINLSSSDPKSPLYYITKPEHVILRPNVLEAFAILRIFKVPVYLLTRQRCISKGLATRQQVNDVNRRVEELLGFGFRGILVEESEETKINLYRQVRELNCSVSRQDIHMFDDSSREWQVAGMTYGMSTHNGLYLYQEVCKTFHITP